MQNPINTTSRDSLLATSSIVSSDDFPQRANRAHTLAARAGRWQFMPLATILGILGIVLLFVAAVTAAGSVVISLFAALLLFLAILAAIRFRPEMLEAGVRNFENASSEYVQTIGKEISDRADEERRRISEANTNWIQDSLLNNASLTQIANGLNDSIQESETRKETLAAEIEALSVQERSAQDKTRAEKNALQAASSRWSSKIFAWSARKAARCAVSAIENLTGISLRLVATRSAFEMAEYRRSFLVEARASFLCQVLEPLTRLKDDTFARLHAVELEEKSGFPLLSLKPTLGELRAPVEAVVSDRLGQIRQRLANRATNESADQAVAYAVAELIQQAGIVPESFADYWAKCNGNTSLILDSLDAESKGFSVIEPTPGRSRVQFRYCLTAGGASSLPFESVRGRSQGISVRAVNLADPTDLVVATLEKFVPGSEEIEFRHAAEVFDRASEDVQAAIVYACADETIRRYKPEQAVDADYGFRLLFLGLIWNQILRTGSEEYRYTTTTGKRVLISKGWEEAALRIQTDKNIADEIEARLNRQRESAGQATANARMEEAVQKAQDIVPTAAACKFREIIGAELKRQGVAA